MTYLLYTYITYFNYTIFNKIYSVSTINNVRYFIRSFSTSSLYGEPSACLSIFITGLSVNLWFCLTTTPISPSLVITFIPTGYTATDSSNFIRYCASYLIPWLAFMYSIASYILSFVEPTPLMRLSKSSHKDYQFLPRSLFYRPLCWNG